MSLLLHLSYLISGLTHIISIPMKKKERIKQEFSKFMMLDGAFESSKLILKVYQGLFGIINDRFNLFNET